MESTDKTVSIVVPVYNVEQWLDECLTSIHAQTFQSWECILVDDGSQDFSGIICDSWARKDPRFQVIHQKNCGVSAARNAGIEKANSRYLSFIDPDDIISINFYEVLVSSMESQNADFAAAPYFIIDEHGRPDRQYLFLNSNRRSEYRKNKLLYVSKDEIIPNMIDFLTGGCWGYVFNRELWRDTRFPVEFNLAEDLAVVPVVLARANRAAFVPEATYYYRKRPGSLMTLHTGKKRLVGCIDASNMMYSDLMQMAPEYEQVYLRLKASSDVENFLGYVQGHPAGRKGKSALFRMFQLYDELKRGTNDE